MLQIYSLSDAQNSILRRQVTPTQISPALQASLTRIFGEPLTPAAAVQRILADVRANGDAAVLDYTQRIDGVSQVALRVPASELHEALDQLDPALREALTFAAQRVRQFHNYQPIHSWHSSEMGGMLGQQVTPLQRVGIYVPGGSAPLPSSLLMAAIPAQVAGVAEIVVCSPPQRDTGRIHPVILATAALLGLDQVYAVGGAQAIGALAFGTSSLARVDKIVGPGNLFVTLAKQQVFGLVGLDGLAGPTETMVIADESANPRWVAADLLAQAEHDPLASAILLTPSLAFAQAVQVEVQQQVQQLSRSEIIQAALRQQSGIVLLPDLLTAASVANAYAAEHLCVAVHQPDALLPLLHNAGGIFVGEHSFEVLGDYVAGPSHIMPTGGTARFASPVNVLDFVKIVSIIALDATSADALSRVAAQIARAEQLTAHAHAADLRATHPTH
jgi:histidinol dehydrogenase